MKKKLILSTLLLTQPLVPFTTQALVHAHAAAFSDLFNNQTLLFKSTAPVQFHGQQYELTGNILGGSFTEKNAEDGKIYDFQGYFELSIPGQKRGIQLGEQDDGDLLFEKIFENGEIIKYVGYSCSSTISACEPENFELVYKKTTNTWEMSIDIMIDNKALKVSNVQFSVAVKPPKKP